MSVFRFLSLFFICAFLCSTANADKVFHTVSVGYFQWQELLTATSSTAEIGGRAQFFGNSFSYEHEAYTGHWGNSYQFEAFIGQANGGKPGTTPAYLQTYQSFFGGAFTYKWAYRPSGYISLLSGPMVLYRGITWPDQSGVSAQSGSDINGGIVFEAKVRPNQDLEIFQKIGLLGIKATYFFSLGLGLKF